LDAGETVALDPAGIRTGQPVTISNPAAAQSNGAR